MNILRFELRKYLPSTFIWAISLSFFGYLCINLFTMFTSDINFFRQMLSAYSPEFLQAFGAQLGTIETLTGFYSFCFMYIVLCGALQAFYISVRVTSQEIAGKSADFLYTKPITRWKIMTYKLICVLLCLVVLNIIYTVVTVFAANAIDIAYDQTLFITINLGMFLTQILFATLGFLLGCTMKKIKTPLSLTCGIVCFFFLLQMVVNLEPDGMLSYFSFLSYTSADIIMTNQGFEPIRLFLLSCLSIVFLMSGYYVFQKRDIHSL